MRYLDLLEAQLVDASRELADTPSGVGVRLRPRRLGRRRPARTIAAVAVLAVATASGGAAAAGVFSPPDLSAPSPLGPAKTVPGSLASAFSVFRRGSQPQDALPPGLTAIGVAGGVAAHYGINVKLSRFIGTVHGTRVWIVAGSTGACMYTAAQGSACSPNEMVTTRGSFALQVPVSSGPDTMLGIIPDGATVTATNADGSAARVSRSGAAFSVSDDPHLRSVTIHEADGQAVTLPIPTTRPPQTP